MRGYLVFAMLVAGCNDDGGHATVDARRGSDGDVSDDADPFVCWPSETPIDRGSVLVGTGGDVFEDFGATVMLHGPGQTPGYSLFVNARMAGLVPGNPMDYFDPTNPHTRVRAFLDATNVELYTGQSCGARNGYVPDSVGAYDYRLGNGLILGFDECWRAVDLVGKQLRFEVEVMDKDGGYAKGTAVVTGGDPDYVPDGDDQRPGCP